MSFKGKKGDRVKINISLILDGISQNKPQSRLHGISALKLIAEQADSAGRLKLLQSQAYFDAILYLIRHASSSEVDTRCRIYAIHTLIAHVLDAPVVDQLLLSHEEAIPSLLQASQSEHPQVLAAVSRAFDYLAVCRTNRPVLALTDGVLEALGALLGAVGDVPEGETAGPTARHALACCRYLAEQDRLLFPMARCEPLLDGLCQLALVPEDEDGRDPTDAAETPRVGEGRVEAESFNVLLALATLPANLPVLRQHELLMDVALEAAERSQDATIADVAMTLLDFLADEEELNAEEEEQLRDDVELDVDDLAEQERAEAEQ